MSTTLISFRSSPDDGVWTWRPSRTSRSDSGAAAIGQHFGPTDIDAKIRGFVITATKT
jgi:hypothetical protein